MPDQIASELPRDTSNAVRLWAQEAVAWANGILVLIGIFAIWNWVWPDREGLVKAATVLGFAAWIVLVVKLKIMRSVGTVGSSVAYLASRFVIEFTFVFLLLSVWDLTRHKFDGQSLENSTAAGLIFAAFGAWSRKQAYNDGRAA